MSHDNYIGEIRKRPEPVEVPDLTPQQFERLVRSRLVRERSAYDVRTDITKYRWDFQGFMVSDEFDEWFHKDKPAWLAGVRYEAYNKLNRLSAGKLTKEQV